MPKLQAGKLVPGQAFVPALELAPGDGGKGAQPLSAPEAKPEGNLPGTQNK